MQTMRTFIAVELSSAVRRRAGELIAHLQTAEAKVTWVRPEQMHVTLKFLGDVPNIEVPKVCAAVVSGSAACEPFELGLHRAGAFPDVERARTLWIGVDRGLEPVRALQHSVESQLARLGFPKERRQFHPHLTIGRVRQGGPELQDLSQLLNQFADFNAGTCSIGEVLVLGSFLDPSGPTHEVLGRAPLKLK